MTRKAHLGSGHIILPEYVNVDQVQLAGVDVVHDLGSLPWPFDNEQFEEVLLINVMEHLPSIVEAMEEIYRITRPNGRVIVRVPYYHSWDATADPTHRHFFNESSFDFFDQRTSLGRDRAYYSKATFQVNAIGFIVHYVRKQFMICGKDERRRLFGVPEPYRIPILASDLVKKTLQYLAHPIGNTIRALHVELIRQ